MFTANKTRKCFITHKELTCEIPCHERLWVLKLCIRGDNVMNSWSNNVLKANELRQRVWLRVSLRCNFLRSRGLFWCNFAIWLLYLYPPPQTSAGGHPWWQGTELDDPAWLSFCLCSLCVISRPYSVTTISCHTLVAVMAAELKYSPCPC